LETTLSVNGKQVELKSDGASPLILALRNELGLTGTRFGCGAEDCGACTVLINSTPHYSCTYLVADAAGKDVKTVEGLTGRVAQVLRDALVGAGAGQCGYCLTGIFVTTHTLMAGTERPTSDALKLALSRHLCRCGAQAAIVRGINRAIKEVARFGGYNET
jgi:nicotinate dehydrogenase subunit A